MLSLILLCLLLLLGYLYYRMRSASQGWESTARKMLAEVARLRLQLHHHSETVVAQEMEILKLSEKVLAQERELESLRYRI